MQVRGLSTASCVVYGFIAMHIAIYFLSTFVSASNGDRSVLFQRCVYLRYRHDCVNVTVAINNDHNVDSSIGFTRYLVDLVVGSFGSTTTWSWTWTSFTMTPMTWSCMDECQYRCMWTTVDAHVKYGERVPQFYGKWPFVRFFGMQEPASAIFSFLNGIITYTMWKNFQRKTPRSAPTYYVWNGYALVSMNAWFWSTVFHTRDTAITEMLDYFSATSCVLYSFYGLCARIFCQKSRAATIVCAIACCSFFIVHVHYLTFVNFDYGYNMVASVSIGLLNSFGWIVWSMTHYQQEHQKYVWKCVAVVSSVTLLVLLEVMDFPPIWWTFDAHSLWHLGTIPLPLLWYSFLIDDCRYILNENKLGKLV